MSWAQLLSSTITRQGGGYLPIVLGQLTGSELAIAATSATAQPHWRLALWLKLLVDDASSPLAPAALETHRQAVLLGQKLLITNPKPDLSCRAVLEIPPWHEQITIQAWQRLTAEALPTAITNDAVIVGQPLRMAPTGRLNLAIATSQAGARVVGLVAQDAAAGSTTTYRTEGAIERSDWTPITGTAELVPGAAYFLAGSSGRLSTTAPTSSGQWITEVGKALSTRVLDLEIQPSIGL